MTVFLAWDARLHLPTSFVPDVSANGRGNSGHVYFWQIDSVIISTHAILYARYSRTLFSSVMASSKVPIYAVGCSWSRMFLLFSMCCHSSIYFASSVGNRGIASSGVLLLRTALRITIWSSSISLSDVDIWC